MTISVSAYLLEGALHDTPAIIQDTYGWLHEGEEGQISAQLGKYHTFVVLQVCQCW